MEKLIWLIPTLPLLGFTIISLFNKWIPKSISGYIASATILGSFAIVLPLLFKAIAGTLSPTKIILFDWIQIGDVNLTLSFLVDNLSVWFMTVITGVGFLIHVYSTAYMHDDEGVNRYFAYLNLFVFSMLTLVMGSNFVVLFAGWEGVGLCSYLLIGFWFKKHDYNDAAKKAFIMNRIGDLGFLLGMLLIFTTFGSFEFDEVFSKMSSMSGTVSTTLFVVITLLLFIGATGKSAQIPLYTWLPDAMAGPTPVSALIHAATMVTAGIYMITRANVLFSLAPFTLDIIFYIGTATALIAALIGLTQNDIKKVLAYSTVSQLGFMFIAIGLGGYSIAVFHVTTHAFFKALLFLGSGSVIHAMGGEQDIRKMGGLKKALPITYITFLIGTCAIAGIPPLSGFFSKDAILALALEKSILHWIIVVFAALLTAFYMFRMFFLTFTGEFRGTHEQKHHLHESPLAMTLPLMVLAILATVGGFIEIPHVLGGHNWFSHYLNQNNLVALLPASHLSANQELMFMGIALSMVLAVIAFTYSIYVSKKVLPANEGEKLPLFTQLSYHKFYVDEIYKTLFVKPVYILSVLFKSLVDNAIIDGVVNGVGVLVKESGTQLRKTQTGSIGFYVLFMILGLVTILFVHSVL
jgi:NADH-quinone oxidoreductase subunit L